MTRQISELMDGELDTPAAEATINRLKGPPPSDEDWTLYHLIGDTIRQQAFFSPVLLSHVSARLAAEPTVLAPRPARRERLLRYAAVVAASVAVVAVVGWVGIQGTGETRAPQVAAVPDPAVSARPAHVPMPTRFNDYLLAHQEYSPSSVVHGVVPYVRTVSMTAEAGGR